MIGYKIRRISDGKFSLGGCWPSFARTGKVWAHRGALLTHLALVKASRPKYIQDWGYPDDWQIVQVTVAEASAMSVADFLNKVAHEKD